MLSAGAVVEKDGRFLMIRDTARGRLVLPGGHLHWNESPQAGAQREVREETGHEIAVGRLIGAYGFDSGLSERGIIRLMYEATIVGGSEQPSAEGTVEWVTLDDLEADGSKEAFIIRDSPLKPV